jgi:hypothetical protein
MTEKTEWYPPNVKPVREGVYETATEKELKYGKSSYNNWTGKYFGFSANKPEDAAEQFEESLLNGSFYWRGLSEESK